MLVYNKQFTIQYARYEHKSNSYLLSENFHVCLIWRAEKLTTVNHIYVHIILLLQFSALVESHHHAL